MNKKSFLKYKPEFYSKLSNDERQSIYQAAAILCNGFLNFDSNHWGISSSFMGSGAGISKGGGVLALGGRLALLAVAYPILVRIATDLAIESGLINLGVLKPSDASNIDWEACFDQTGRPSPDKIRKLWENSEDPYVLIDDTES
jgi:hypothetical protein